jgi:hypothetical protein
MVNHRQQLAPGIRTAKVIVKPKAVTHRLFFWLALGNASTRREALLTAGEINERLDRIRRQGACPWHD